MPVKNNYPISRKNYLTEVRADIKEVKTEVKLNTIDIKSINRGIGYLGDDVKGLNKRFDNLEEMLFKWKSDLFTKIDNSYAKPIRNLQEETAAQHVRQNRQQTEIDKINQVVFNQ